MNPSNINNDNFSSSNSSVNYTSVLWVKKEKLDSIIHVPLYSNLSSYFQGLNKDVKVQEKESNISKMFLLFDDNSCIIAIDISPLYEIEDNKIPLLIYERYYFWSLHFLFEKSKIKKQQIELEAYSSLSESIKKCTIFEDVYMYTSIYNSAYNKNGENNVNYKSSELVKNGNKNMNRELTIYNNDYIKYLYLNDLKNNRNTFSENNIYTNNEIKWYRLKIKIDNVEKKIKKKKNYFSYDANKYSHNFREGYLKNSDRNSYNNLNEISLINNATSSKSLDKLLKIHKSRNFNICNEEKKKNKNEICNNNNNKKNWYYYRSSSNCSSDSEVFKEEEDSNMNSNRFYTSSILSEREMNYNKSKKRKNENSDNAPDMKSSKHSKINDNSSISCDVSKGNNSLKYKMMIDNVNESVSQETNQGGKKYTSCKNVNGIELINSILVKEEFRDSMENEEKLIINGKIGKIRINEEDIENKDLMNSGEGKKKKKENDERNRIIEDDKEENSIKKIKNVDRNIHDDTEILIEPSCINNFNNNYYITTFKFLFPKMYEQKSNKNHISNHSKNNLLDRYINKILKNMINRKRPHLNSLSKNFERIENFYKQSYKICIIDNKDFLNDKKYFKNNDNFYILSDKESKSSSFHIVDEDYYDLFELFKKYLISEKNEYEENNMIQIYNNGDELNKNGSFKNDNEEYKETKMNKDNLDNIVSPENKQNISKENGENHMEFNEENRESINKENDNNNNEENFAKENMNTQNFTEDNVVFYATNKKNKNCKKYIKEGDYVYIKFNESYDGFDKIRILKKETVLYILIYLMKNKEILKLSNISTYSPELLWNISLHFKKNILNLELCLEKMFKYLSSDNKRELSDIFPFDEKKIIKQNYKKEYQKKMEIMKLKDNVAFLDKFLQNVNDMKLKKLKLVQKEYNEKYQYKRSINNLNNQQLIELFIDKENEVNVLPLYILKEKSRNIIYEENIKMNMFACIKVTFDQIKGRCIYAASDLKKFDFIFEYVGELLTHNEALKREKIYIKNKKKGCYMFYFKHDDKRYCIDGTEENVDAAINNKDKKYFLRSFARLVNHSKKNSNIIPKVLKVSNIPRLFFVASRNIKEGEELLVDYGERDKEIIKNNAWLKC